MSKRLFIMVLISVLLLGCGSKGAEAIKVMDDLKTACDAEDKTAAQKTMTNEMWKQFAIGIAFTADKDASPEEAWGNVARGLSKTLGNVEKREVIVVDEKTVRVSYPKSDSKDRVEFVVKNIDGKWKITTLE